MGYGLLKKKKKEEEKKEKGGGGKEKEEERKNRPKVEPLASGTVNQDLFQPLPGMDFLQFPGQL